MISDLTLESLRVMTVAELIALDTETLEFLLLKAEAELTRIRNLRDWLAGVIALQLRETASSLENLAGLE